MYMCNLISKALTTS